MKTLYLCGPINGRTDADATNWREAVKAAWPGVCLDPMRRDYRGRELEPGAAPEPVACALQRRAGVLGCRRPRPPESLTMLAIAISIYAAAMIVANLSIAAFGPWVSPINAFLLIGLDLALRDVLHVRLKAWQMGALIGGTGLLTYALNPAAGTIAVASSVAFTAAAVVDWATFARLRGSWLYRANGSNVAGAAVDSLLFPTLAFGALMPHIVALQFVSKVAGGAVWATLLHRRAGAAA